jgi:hypothetical protein
MPVLSTPYPPKQLLSLDDSAFRQLAGHHITQADAIGMFHPDRAALAPRKPLQITNDLPRKINIREQSPADGARSTMSNNTSSSASTRKWSRPGIAKSMLCLLRLHSIFGGSPSVPSNVSSARRREIIGHDLGGQTGRVRSRRWCENCGVFRASDHRNKWAISPDAPSTRPCAITFSPTRPANASPTPTISHSAPITHCAGVGIEYFTCTSSMNPHDTYVRSARTQK